MMDTVNGLLEELERIGWKYRDVQEMEDGKAHVACDVTGKSAQVTFHFFFDADSHALSLRVFKLFATPIDKRLQIMERMNAFNAQFRWIKFFLDQDNWMNLQSDAVVNGGTSGKICVELMVRSIQIIDQTYPEFMHEIWA